MPLYDYRCDEGHRFERVLPLARYDEPQACRCGAPSQKLIAAPRLQRVFSEPIQSMADGKYYSDAASLERTYQASGNPQGVNYAVVGDDPPKEYKRPGRTKADIDHANQAISRALDEHGF